MNEPKLATKVYRDHGETYRITVRGGLHYIRGNSSPYFSITADQYRKAKNNRWVEDSFGCQHELIDRLWPGKFSDLIALHLANVDGEPSHGAANGWYFARGGQWFPARTWLPHDGPTYKVPATPEDCVNSLMRHFRINREDARTLASYGQLSILQDKQRFAAEDAASLNAANDYAYNVTPFEVLPVDPANYRQLFDDACAAMRERFKQEAADCIAKHDLVIYGDKWEAAA